MEPVHRLGLPCAIGPGNHQNQRQAGRGQIALGLQQAGPEKRDLFLVVGLGYLVAKLSSFEHLRLPGVR